MKPFRRILYLSALVAGILVFWLMPKVNTAKDVRYTRVFENTETKAIRENTPKDTVGKTVKPAAEARPLLTEPAKKKPDQLKKELLIKEAKKERIEKSAPEKAEKKYVKESIEADFKIKDIKPSMYSRAIHFEPEELLLEDTVQVLP